MILIVFPTGETRFFGLPLKAWSGVIVPGCTRTWHYGSP